MKKSLLILVILVLFIFSSMAAVAGLARIDKPTFVGEVYSNSTSNTQITTWMIINDSPDGFDKVTFQPLKDALESSGYTEKAFEAAENTCYIRDLESPTVAATLTCVRRDTPLAHTIGLSNDRKALVAIFQDIGQWTNPNWKQMESHQ